MTGRIRPILHTRRYEAGRRTRHATILTPSGVPLSLSLSQNFPDFNAGQRENTFANMYATLRWHFKYTNIFLTNPETALITNNLQPVGYSLLDQKISLPLQCHWINLWRNSYTGVQP